MSAGPDRTRDPGATLDRRLGRALSQARLALLWERLWPALSAPLGVAALFLVVSWFGVWLVLPPLGRTVLLALFAILAVASLWPLLQVRAPSREAARRRLELTSGLDHRPLAALSDTLVGTPDEATRALWEAHRRRVLARIGSLRAGPPSPRLDRRDPYALRALMALLLVAAFAMADGERGRRVLAAFESVPEAKAAPLRVDAWVAPPAYTGRPPIVLTQGGEGAPAAASMPVPAKSTVVVRLEGGDARVERVGPDGTATPAETQTGGGRLAEHRVVLDGDASVRVVRGEAAAAQWAFTVEADRVPTIAFAKEPETATSGAIKFNYKIEDDYGVVEAEARFTPLADRNAKAEARPLYGPPIMKLALPGRRSRAGTAETLRDLTEHPWAGGKVRVVLAAKDEAEQWGVGVPKDVGLPTRRFTKPLARALVEQRRALALDANAKDRVGKGLDALMIDPERRIADASIFLGMTIANSRLKNAADDDALRSVVDLLWQVALRAEDGDLSDAARDLRAAQEALREALENGATNEEIERLMQQLREAMNRFMSEMAAQAQRAPENARPLPPNAKMLSQQDLDRMMKRIEDLAKSGSRDAARELLAQMQNMMENLQAGRPQPGQQGGEPSPGEQALNELGRMIQEQQRLMNETFRRGQQGQQGRQGNQGRQGRQGRGRPQGGQQGQGNQPGQGEQPGEGMSPGELAEAMRQLQQGQGALRQQLQQLMDQLGQMGQGGQGGQQLGQAGEAMGGAERSLGDGAPGDAVGQQSQALDRLRRGAQSLQQQMAEQQGQGEGQGPGGPPRGGPNGYAQDDPLGRPQRNRGPMDDFSVRVPEEIDVQRAREILEELRRRLGEASRPRLELDYLERLLEQF